MNPKEKIIFYQSKRLLIGNAIVLMILLLFFMAVSSISLMILIDLFDNGFKFGKLLVSIPLLVPMILCIYLTIGIYSLLFTPEHHIVCKIENNKLHIFEYGITIPKYGYRKILDETFIPISDIKSVQIKNTFLGNVLKLDFNFEKHNIHKRQINQALNRISNKDKERLKNEVESVNYNRNQFRLRGMK